MSGEDNKTKKLGEILVESGAISLKELETFLKEQEELKDERGYQTKLGSLLLENKLLDEETLALAFSAQMGIEYYDLSQHQPDLTILEKIPFSILNRFKFIPLTLDSQKLVITIHDPVDTFLFDLLYKALGVAIEYKSSTRTAIDFKHKECLKLLADSGRVNNEFDVDFEEYRLILQQEKKKQQPKKEAKTEVSTKNSLEEEALDDILMHFLKHTRYSSLLFKHDTATLVNVYGKLSGAQEYYGHMSTEAYSEMLTAIRSMANLNEEDIHYITQAYIEMPFSEEEFHTFSITFLPTPRGIAINIEEYPQEYRTLDLSRIGFLPNDLTKLKGLDLHERGVLILGAQQSGKSTLVQSFLEHKSVINTTRVLLEDKESIGNPPYSKVLIDPERTQLQSMAYLQNSTVDVVGLDCMTPQEIATTLRPLGHRSTISASLVGAPIFPFLTSMEKQGMGLGFILSRFHAILFTKLVPNLCPYCIQPHRPKPEEIAKAGIKPESLKKPFFNYSAGCDYCENSGSGGFEMIYEMLYINPQVTRLLQEHPLGNEVAVQLLKSGNLVSLNNVAREKLYQGRISLQTYLQILQKKI